MNKLKGYKTYIIGFALAVGVPGLQYLAGLDWTKLVDPKWAPLIAGGLLIALRTVTDTGPGQKS